MPLWSVFDQSHPYQSPGVKTLTALQMIYWTQFAPFGVKQMAKASHFHNKLK